jgi:hypothetical protein
MACRGAVRSTWHDSVRSLQPFLTMHRAIRLSKRARGALLPALAVVCAVAVGVASCVSAAPAEPPQSPPLGPIIVQDSVMPVASAYLPALPPSFRVPVRAFDPTRLVLCHVFVDFDPGQDNVNSTGFVAACAPTPPALDGGVTQLSFMLLPTQLGDPTACHVIQCFVADAFDPKSQHTPGDSLGADSVTWQYAPNGPGSCTQFSGADGSFSVADAAPTDAQLPFTSDSVAPL